MASPIRTKEVYDYAVRSLPDFGREFRLLKMLIPQVDLGSLKVVPAHVVANSRLTFGRN